MKFIKYFLAAAILTLSMIQLSCSKEAEATDDSPAQTVSGQTEQSEVPVLVSTAEVTTGDLVKNIKTQGLAVSRRNQTFTSKVEGRIMSGVFENGRHVKKGDIILKIDERPYKLAFDKAEATLSRAMTEFMFYDIDDKKESHFRQKMDNLENQYKKGTLTFDDYLKQSLALRKEAVLNGSLQEEIAFASTGISDARYALEQARIALENCTLRAPFDGVIADMTGFQGRYVYQGETLFSFIDTSSIYVKASLMETELPYIKIGKGVTLSFPAYRDRTFQGTIDEINPIVDEKDRTVSVYIKVNNSDKLVFQGMYADVTVDTVRIKDQMLVPVSAVVIREERPLVFVIDEDSRAKWIYVKIVDKNDRMAAIVSDSDYDSVKVGDTVVSSNNFTLGHGSLIKEKE